jgi:hypothetical protein
VSEDLENLLKDISGHYKRLLKANKPKAEKTPSREELGIEKFLEI